MGSSRHLFRIIAMQSLYENEFRSDLTIDEIVQRNVDKLIPDVQDLSFLTKLISGVEKNKDETSKMIEKYAPEFPLDQIPVVDKVLLWMSIYELIYDKEIPPKVAINEAVELGKSYGGDNSSKFVNGVLGTIYTDFDMDNKKVVLSKEKKKEIEEAKKANKTDEIDSEVIEDSAEKIIDSKKSKKSKSK